MGVSQKGVGETDLALLIATLWECSTPALQSLHTFPTLPSHCPHTFPRTGVFLFQFLADFNIRDSTLSIINSTIDASTQVLQGVGMEAGQSAANTRAHTVA